MAKDARLFVRKAVIRHLRADASVTGLVPPDRISSKVMADAPKPRVRYGVPSKLPFRASCIDGTSVTFTIHAFSAQESEDEATIIGAAIARSLDGMVIDLAADAGYPAKATITWTGGQTLSDADEADHWHEIVNFEAVVTS